jgi:hypothetical protein
MKTSMQDMSKCMSEELPAHRCNTSFDAEDMITELWAGYGHLKTCSRTFNDVHNRQSDKIQMRMGALQDIHS